MGRLTGAIVAFVLSGCWLSHAALDEAGDERDGAVREDGGAADADAVRDADAGAESSAEDGADPDAPDVPCWDLDGDGHPSTDCGGDDCNDGDPSIYPGAPDVCGDGLDTNCDGLDPVGDGPLGTKVLLADTPATGGNMYTALLWTGREYLFVWRKIGLESVRLVRLDTGGKRLGDEVPLRSFEYAYDVAWSGSRLGAVWNEGDDGAADVFFQAYDVTGRALTDAVRVSDTGLAVTDGGVHFGPRIVAAGDDFFVAWQEDESSGRGSNTVRLERLAPDGAPRFPPVEVESSSEPESSTQGLELAWTGSEAAVMYGVGGGLRGGAGLRLQRLDGAGTRVGAAHAVSDIAAYDTQCQLVWTGAELAAFWTDSGVMLSRMDPTGAEILRASLAPPLWGYFPEQRPVVWANGYFGVVWAEHPEAGWQVTLRRFEPSGRVHGSSITVPASGIAGRLDIAWTGSEYGFIWSEEAADSPDPIKVYFQRATFCE